MKNAYCENFSPIGSNLRFLLAKNNSNNRNKWRPIQKPVIFIFSDFYLLMPIKGPWVTPSGQIFRKTDNNYRNYRHKQ